MPSPYSSVYGMSVSVFIPFEFTVILLHTYYLVYISYIRFYLILISLFLRKHILWYTFHPFYSNFFTSVMCLIDKMYSTNKRCIGMLESHAIMRNMQRLFLLTLAL